jgi:hypothetical protein
MSARVEGRGDAPLCGQRLRTLWYRNGPLLVAVDFSPTGGSTELTIALDADPSEKTLYTQDMGETDPDLVKYRAMLDFKTTTLRLRTSTVGHENQCLDMSRSASSSQYFSLGKADCDEASKLQQFLRCGDTCNPDTCAAFQGRAFCVENGLGPLCQCKPGYLLREEEDGTKVCEPINACINHPCQDTHYCVRADTVVEDNVDGRECVPRTGCEPGFKAEPAVDTLEGRASDTVCTPCDAGQFQPVDDFHGEECLDHSEPCRYVRF